MNRGTETVVSWKRMWYWSSGPQVVVHPGAWTRRNCSTIVVPALTQRKASLYPVPPPGLAYSAACRTEVPVASSLLNAPAPNRFRSPDVESTSAS